MTGEQAMLRKPLFGSRLNVAHTLSKGLAGCWLLNESAGIQATDLSPYKNHGVLTGFDSPPKRTCNGLVFDGVDDHIDCGSTAVSLGMTDRITMEVWAKASKIDNTRRYAMGKNYGRNGILIHETANLWWGELYLDDVYNWIVSGKVADTDWCHVVVTYDKDGGADNALIYIDGYVDGSYTLTGQIDSTYGPWNIGFKGGGGGDLYFGGSIHLARIWNRALSAQDIKNLYLSPYAPMGESMYL